MTYKEISYHWYNIAVRGYKGIRWTYDIGCRTAQVYHLKNNKSIVVFGMYFYYVDVPKINVNQVKELWNIIG